MMFKTGVDLLWPEFYLDVSINNSFLRLLTNPFFAPTVGSIFHLVSLKDFKSAPPFFCKKPNDQFAKLDIRGGTSSRSRLDRSGRWKEAFLVSARDIHNKQNG